MNPLASKNQRQYLKITLLAPVHIGNGQEAFVKEGELLRFEQLVEELLANVPLSAEGLSAIKRKIQSLIVGSEKAALHVRSQLYDLPMVPGSSLKGWLRTLMVRRAIETTGIKPKCEDGKDKKYEDKLITKLIGNFENSLMRHFHCYDFLFKSSEVWRSKVVGAPVGNGQGGWKNKLRGEYGRKFDPKSFFQLKEALPPKAISYGYIDYEVRRALWEKVKKGFTWGNYSFIHSLLEHLSNPMELWKTIFQWNTKFMEKYVEKELEFFNYFDFDHREKVLKQLKELKQKLKESDGTFTIIRLGWGIGFHAVTGDWRYDKHLPLNKPKKGRIWYKTRRIFFKNTGSGGYCFYLPGFVRLELLTSKEGEKAFKEYVEGLLETSTENKVVSSSEKSSREPKPYRGKIKRGKRCEAKVIADSLVLIRLQEGNAIKEVTATLKDYGGQLPKDTLIEVEFIEDNKCERVRFRSKLS